METTLTINIPAPSARARGTGVGGGEDGGGKEEKTNVCFKVYGFLHSSTTLHNRLIQVLKRSLLTKTSCYALSLARHIYSILATRFHKTREKYDRVTAVSRARNWKNLPPSFYRYGERFLLIYVFFFLLGRLMKCIKRILTLRTRLSRVSKQRTSTQMSSQRLNYSNMTF